MLAPVYKQRLREHFARVTEDAEAEEEPRLPSPGVKGIVTFLQSISENDVFGIDEVRDVFQAKEWAEDVDITWTDLEALVDALFAKESKGEAMPMAETNLSTMTEIPSLPSGEHTEDAAESPAAFRIKSEESVPNSSSLPLVPEYEFGVGANEDEVKERKLLLQKVTLEQSRAAAATVRPAYEAFRKSLPPMAATCLPDEPPQLFAANQYYRSLSDARAIQNGTASPKGKKPIEKVTASPMKRIKKTPAEPEEVGVAQMHSTAKVGSVVHFTGFVMGVEEEVRRVDINDATTGVKSSNAVVNVVLADEGGAIQLTLWREQARSVFPVIDQAIDAVRGNSCAKVKFTNLILRDVRYPGPKIRMLHSSETTQCVLEGEENLAMSPAPELFPTMDFRDLNKLSLPSMLHLRGTITGDRVERTTSKGAEQVCFELMDANKRSVPCIGHNILFPAESFTAGMEVALFCVTVQEGLRNGQGSVWIYSTSYIVFLGNKVLPGIPIDTVSIRGKDEGTRHRGGNPYT